MKRHNFLNKKRFSMSQSEPSTSSNCEPSMPFTEPTADGDNNDRGVRQSVDFNVQLDLTDDLKV